MIAFSALDPITELTGIDLLVRTLGQRCTGSAKQLITIVPGGLLGPIEGERCVPLAGEREPLLDVGVNVPVGVVDDGEIDVFDVE